jgi:hypothetical protein
METRAPAARCPRSAARVVSVARATRAVTGGRAATSGHGAAGGCLFIDDIRDLGRAGRHQGRRHGCSGTVYFEHGDTATIGSSCDQVHPGELDDLAAISAPTREPSVVQRTCRIQWRDVDAEYLAVVVILNDHSVNLSLHGRIRPTEANEKKAITAIDTGSPGPTTAMSAMAKTIRSRGSIRTPQWLRIAFAGQPGRACRARRGGRSKPVDRRLIADPDG